MKGGYRGAAFVVVLFVAVILLVTLLGGGTSVGAKKTVHFDEFIKSVQQDKIQAVLVQGSQLTGIYKESQVRAEDMPQDYDFRVFISSEEDLKKEIRIAKGDETLPIGSFGFAYSAKEPEATPIFWTMIPYILILGVLVVFFVVFLRQHNAQGGAMNFGRSRARLSNKDDKNKVTFRDLAGLEEEKEELAEIVDFLKGPRRYIEMGARIPKGILLVGPPGCGKTLLAKAVAGEAGVPFFSISGSDFVELYVGVGASRVRDLFEQAKKSMPCIVFIDEIDAVGRQRGAGLGGGHDEREQTLNQLLVEMDGFTVNEGIIIIAATNRPDILDPALLRPGRFDRQVTVSYPDIKGREAILEIHSRKKPLDQDVKLSVIARMTPYFTGADLENVMNEGALLAVRNGRQRINLHDLKEAIRRVELGPEKRSRVVTPEDKNLVAYHEAGHAIVAYRLPTLDPVNEVSIIPRGQAGGYTSTLPEKETTYVPKNKLLDMIAMAMGGHAAEHLVLDDVSTGCTGDLKQATQIARRMITEYGMSDEIGPVFLGSDHEVFIGRDFSSQHTYSEKVAAQIDQVMRGILENGYERAESILRDDLEKLHEVVKVLLLEEKIDGDTFKKVMEGQYQLPPDTPPDELGGGSQSSGGKRLDAPAAPPQGSFA